MPDQPSTIIQSCGLTISVHTVMHTRPDTQARTHMQHSHTNTHAHTNAHTQATHVCTCNVGSNHKLLIQRVQDENLFSNYSQVIVLIHAYVITYLISNIIYNYSPGYNTPPPDVCFLAKITVRQNHCIFEEYDESVEV